MYGGKSGQQGSKYSDQSSIPSIPVAHALRPSQDIGGIPTASAFAVPPSYFQEQLEADLTEEQTEAERVELLLQRKKLLLLETQTAAPNSCFC